ncbi:MAG: MarR family transcriptional regulator [Clostridiales bacterium]|nr:MarR family transcriptional regulator [Clostridiales bacterium]
MEDLNRRLMNSLRLTYNLLRRRRIQGVLLEGGESQGAIIRQPRTKGASDMEKKQLLKMKEERSALLQEMILEAVCQEGKPLSQRQLASQLSMSPQTLTEELGRLERKGYVNRFRSKDSLREPSVSLTKQGEERAAELRQIKNRQNAEFFKPLNEEEKETLLTLLDKLNLAEEMGLKENGL